MTIVPLTATPADTGKPAVKNSYVNGPVLTSTLATKELYMIFFYDSIEYLRPWKLATFFCAITLLILGSIYTPAPDWDIPITFIMGIATYLTAPWCMRALLERQWRHWPAMILATWLSVDGFYTLYWHYKDASVLAFMREANFTASLPIYGMAGIFWLYRGSLRQLLAELRSLLSSSFK